ncbi:hypothetical protein [Nocardiopsis eucommiae]|uniref:hypothetical protein n=1 Tax=Nocardiopsis eucommiae TaxID=2831970 RepID=UPI003D726C2C
MKHDTPIPRPRLTEAHIPDVAHMAPRLVDTLSGELRLDIDMVGTGGDRLVLDMSGPLEEVRAQLDTLRSSLAQASTVLEAREFMVREFGADADGGLR